MTREEAKAILENDIVDGHVEGNARFMDAFWMAVDALSQEPCDRIEYGTDGNAYKLWISNGKEFEQEPCTDAVSRDAVLEIICRETEWYDIRTQINELPSVNPQYKECRTLDEFIKEQTE